MNHEWDIRRRGECCSKTGKPFQDGERIVSRLVLGEAGYERTDFAAEHWEPSMGEGALSVWRSTFRLPPPPPPEPMQKETAESLLRRLMEEEDASHQNAIYILAVMLERKRVLVERDVQLRGEGTKLRVYEHRKTGESFVVPDPGLRLSELEQVQKEVVSFIGGSPATPERDERPGVEEENTKGA